VNPKAGVCVDGEHPNQQVRASGRVELFPDDGGLWTGRITDKYVLGPSAAATRESRTSEWSFAYAPTGSSLSPASEPGRLCGRHARRPMRLRYVLRAREPRSAVGVFLSGRRHDCFAARCPDRWFCSSRGWKGPIGPAYEPEEL
jgi:hypothetical protein